MRRHFKTRRVFLTGAGLGLAAAVLVGGCSSGGPSTSVGTVGGGTAIIAVSADPQSLNPGLTTDFVTQDVTSKIYEGLIWLNSHNQPEPELAQSWAISADGRTYTFKLRQGVEWQDGKPFTSADVVWSFKTGLADNSRAQGVLVNVKSISAPSKYKVVIVLKQPYEPFLSEMKVFDVPILPEHVFARTNEQTNPADNAPVGTGPFRFQSWDRGSKIVLVRNPYYWDKSDEPKLSEIVYAIVPDDQTRATGIEHGDYDYLASFYAPTSDYAQFKETPGLKVYTSTAIPALDFMLMNESNPALANTADRQAIALAVDRPRIVSQAMSALAIEGKGSFGEGFSWIKPGADSYDKLYPFDPVAAREKLASAGVGKLSLNLIYDSSRPTLVADAQIIQEDLAAIGVAVNLQPVETTVFADKVYTQRDYDLALTSFTSSGDPAIGYNRIYTTNTTRLPNENPTGYSNPQVDQLLKRAAEESQQSQRAALYEQAETILNQQVPTLILADELEVDVASTRLTGMWAGVNPLDQWQNVSLQG